MAKVKYYYDSEKLAYRKITPKKRKKFGFAALFIVASALFGFLSFVVLLNVPYFKTPNDRVQQREIENLRLNYSILNKKLEQLQVVADQMADRDNNLYRTYFNTTPITEEERKSGYKNNYVALQGYNNSELLIRTTKKVDVLSKELAIQSKSLDAILKLAEAKQDFLASIPAIQPVQNEKLRHVASGFGYRTDPFTKARKMHEGMDFTAKTGTPIFASGDGIVARADNSASGFGNHIVIRHGYGYESLYAHLSKYKCRAGQRVKRGDIIGYVGNTGRSEAPHLHYEVHKNGKVVNPLNFYYGSISAVEYVAISNAANQENQSLD